tara:strand:+ start:3813 stop:5393 length:1581 start_codon:yes stop_codon:yes gene_type:complete
MASFTDKSLADQMSELKIDDSDSESVDGIGMDRLFNPKKAVFTFGRFQPPTKGHEGLIKSIEESGKILEAKPYVFVSLSQNALKDNDWKQAIRPAKNINDYITNKNNENPLSPDIKIEILKKMFPKTKIQFINGFLENPRVYSIQRAIMYLKEKGYTDIYFIVGSQRFKQFKDLDFEKKFTIKLIENKRILDGEMKDERLYELGKLTEEDIQEINNINPTNISGTKVRQLAAEHKINMKDINQLTERQVRLRINGGLVNKIQGHDIKKDEAFIEFKKRMSNKLSDKDLEYYIYQIKKGMALNPFKTYRNQNKNLTRKSTRKGGKKRTRKKRGKGKKNKTTRKDREKREERGNKIHGDDAEFDEEEYDKDRLKCNFCENEIQLTENWGRPWREKGWRPADENWETWMCDECRKSKFYICNHHVNYRYSEIAWLPQHGCFNKVSQEESLPLGWGISKPLFEIDEEALGDDTIMYYCPEHANNFFNQHVPEWEGPRIYSGGKRRKKKTRRRKRTKKKKRRRRRKRTRRR